jgi:hypothetical protein
VVSAHADDSSTYSRNASASARVMRSRCFALDDKARSDPIDNMEVLAEQRSSVSVLAQVLATTTGEPIMNAIASNKHSHVAQPPAAQRSRWASTCAAAVAAGLSLSCGAPPPDARDLAQTEQASVVDDLAKKYLNDADYKDFSAFYKLASDIAEVYPGVSLAISAYNALSDVIGGSEPPVEQVMAAQLVKIKQMLGDVLASINDANWLQAEREASAVYSDVQWASKATRDWVYQNPAVTLDSNSPLGVDVNSKSYSATHVFMDDSWYWFPNGGARRFDHRLALPRLTNSIAVRLGVLEALYPGFAQSGVASAELYEYGDRLGAILDEMESNLIFCYMPPLSGPIVQGSDLSKLTLRRCRNFISGTDVVVQTGAGTVLPEVNARANLMAELGVYQLRALQQKLYRLASGQ